MAPNYISKKIKLRCPKLVLYVQSYIFSADRRPHVPWVAEEHAEGGGGVGRTLVYIGIIASLEGGRLGAELRKEGERAKANGIGIWEARRSRYVGKAGATHSQL